MLDHLLNPDAVAGRRIARGIVTAADGTRWLVCVRQDGEERLVVADLLCTSASPLALQPGDPVLCWVEDDDREHGVILGRIGAPAAPPIAAPVPTPEPSETRTPSLPEGVPDELVLEARRSLTLRVGDGSITIREDGRILIKGKDLVSHAQRMNRIKGGAVSIN